MGREEAQEVERRGIHLEELGFFYFFVFCSFFFFKKFVFCFSPDGTGENSLSGMVVEKEGQPVAFSASLS